MRAPSLLFRVCGFVQYAGSLGLQVKYAVGEAERLGLPSSSSGGAAAGIDQAKLFVGSLPRDVKEEDVSHPRALPVFV